MELTHQARGTSRCRESGTRYVVSAALNATHEPYIDGHTDSIIKPQFRSTACVCLAETASPCGPTSVPEAQNLQPGTMNPRPRPLPAQWA